MASSIPAQVAHALKCNHKYQQFTGHILSSNTTDEYKMEYQCQCGEYIYEIKTGMELRGYTYPTNDEWNKNNP